MALCLLGPSPAKAQWTQPAAPDANISNTNTGNVGVGTGAPNYKFEVSGSASRNTVAVTGDGDAAGYAGIKIQALTTTGIAANRISQFNLHMRKDGWYSGDGSGPSFIIETVSKGGGFAAPFIITPQNHVILNGGRGNSGLPYGWVGVGTTAPATNLHVHGGTAFGAVRVSGAGGGLVHFYDMSAPADQKLYQWRSEGGVFRMSLLNDAESGWVRQNILVANSSGNVGVGTASPPQRLTVDNTVDNGGAANLRLRSATTRYRSDLTVAGSGGLGINAYDDAGAAYLPVQIDASRTILGTQGNVGVGTATPSHKLDVAGHIRSSSGGFVFPDGTVQTTAAAGGVTGVTAGAGLTGGGAGGTLTLANADRGSSQNIFKNVANAAGVAQFSAGSNNDAISFEGTGGTAVTFNAAAKKVTIGSPAASGWTEAAGGASLSPTNASASVGIGTPSPAAGYRLDVKGHVNVTGNIEASGNIAASFQDVAEWVPSVQRLRAGTVVVLDPGRTNHVIASAGAYDTKVAGVVSAQPGVLLGVAGEGKVMVATTGRVRVKVDATRGAIKVGDLLVTSGAEGVAMKSVPVNLGGTQIHRPGTIIGKALEPLEKGTGQILVLLGLQ
jgi:hypothetical protein